MYLEYVIIDRRIRTVRTHPPTDSVKLDELAFTRVIGPTSPYRLSTPKNNRNKHYNSAARLFGDLIGVVITPYRNSCRGGFRGGGGGGGVQGVRTPPFLYEE